MGDISNKVLYIIMGFMLLSGSANTLILKFQNAQASDVNGTHYKNWKHPFAQSVFMFFGESLCLIMFYYMQAQDKKKYGSLERSPALIDAKVKNLKTNISPLLLFIPSIFDNISSSLMFLALAFIPASVYQMT